MSTKTAGDATRPFQPAEVTFCQRLKLLWGRPRRFFLNHFRRRYVDAQLARRKGECRRCGACCQMGAWCRHLEYDEAGLSACKRYDMSRSLNCRNFPIDERDLADRDLVAPGTACGFHFEDDGPASQDTHPADHTRE